MRKFTFSVLTVALLSVAVSCSKVDETQVIPEAEGISSVTLNYDDDTPFGFQMGWNGTRFVDVSGYNEYQFIYQGTPTYDASEGRYYIALKSAYDYVDIINSDRWDDRRDFSLLIDWKMEFEVELNPGNPYGWIFSTEDENYYISDFFVEWDELTRTGKIRLDAGGEIYEVEIKDGSGNWPQSPFGRIIKCTLTHTWNGGSTFEVSDFGTLKLDGSGPYWLCFNPFHAYFSDEAVSRIYSLKVQSAE